MDKTSRLILLNQMAGPLFRQLAEGLAPHYEEGAVLLTGHPDTLSMRDGVLGSLTIQPAPAYDRRSMVKRLISWVKYLLVASRWILGGKKRDAFVIVSNPPLLGGWFWLLNTLRRRPYLLLVYDIHPDVLVMMGVVKESSPVVWIWRWINRRVYRDAAAVVTLGDQMVVRLSRQYDSVEHPPVVIPPWADTDHVAPIAWSDNLLAETFNPDNKHVVLYSGNMGVSHDIDSMLEAALRLHTREDLLFLFIGEGQKWRDTHRFKQKHQLHNIEIYPFQPEENLPMTMALATISLVALDQGAEGLMVPSKLFYYLAAGSAVIGICQGENELRSVIENEQCGRCVEPGQPQQLTNAIEQLLDSEALLTQYRANARSAAERSYSRKAGVTKFSALLQRVGMGPHG